MEPAVRNPRIESAIGLDADISADPIPERRLVSRPESLPPGTEFLDAETGGQKSTLETVIVRRDRERSKQAARSPQKRPLSNAQADRGRQVARGPSLTAVL